MRSCSLVTIWSLVVAAVAYNVTTITDQSTSLWSSDGGIVFSGQFLTTDSDGPAPYTVYGCVFEADAFDGGWSANEFCGSISTVATLAAMDNSTVTPSSTAEPGPVVGKLHRADPASVFNARMDRKFGIQGRSVPAIFGKNHTPIFPGLITVTTTTTISSIPESCLPSPNPRPFPIFHDVSNTAPLAAAESTAMSIVASILNQDIAAMSPTTLPLNVASVMVSVLTANSSAMRTSSSTSMSNMSIASASLTSVTSAPPLDAKSDGPTVKAGVFATLVAAIGIACLLVLGPMGQNE